MTNPSEDHEAPLRRHAEMAAERIRTRVAEDQRIANAVDDNSAPFTGQWKNDGNHALQTYNGWVLAYRADGREWRPGVLDHIVRHDPAHVLARSATLLDVLADLEKIAERSTHPDPREWARLAICELARAWELDEE